MNILNININGVDAMKEKDRFGRKIKYNKCYDMQTGKNFLHIRSLLEYFFSTDDIWDSNEGDSLLMETEDGEISFIFKKGRYWVESDEIAYRGIKKSFIEYFKENVGEPEKVTVKDNIFVAFNHMQLMYSYILKNGSYQFTEIIDARVLLVPVEKPQMESKNSGMFAKTEIVEEYIPSQISIDEIVEEINSVNNTPETNVETIIINEPEPIVEVVEIAEIITADDFTLEEGDFNFEEEEVNYKKEISSNNSPLITEKTIACEENHSNGMNCELECPFNPDGFCKFFDSEPSKNEPTCKEPFIYLEEREKNY